MNQFLKAIEHTNLFSRALRPALPPAFAPRGAAPAKGRSARRFCPVARAAALEVLG